MFWAVADTGLGKQFQGIGISCDEWYRHTHEERIYEGWKTFAVETGGGAQAKDQVCNDVSDPEFKAAIYVW